MADFKYSIIADSAVRVYDYQGAYNTISSPTRKLSKAILPEKKSLKN